MNGLQLKSIDTKIWLLLKIPSSEYPFLRPRFFVVQVNFAVVPVRDEFIQFMMVHYAVSLATLLNRVHAVRLVVLPAFHQSGSICKTVVLSLFFCGDNCASRTGTRDHIRHWVLLGHWSMLNGGYWGRRLD